MTLRSNLTSQHPSLFVAKPEDYHANTLTPTPSKSPMQARPENSQGSGSGSMTGLKGAFDKPKLRLEVRDLNHPGAAKFFAAVSPPSILSAAVDNVLRLLFSSPSEEMKVPPTRSITLILRDMDGVAYTRGTELDNDHKEIHFSLKYINSIYPTSLLKDEIAGVITHEVVHCYQWDGQNSCPGGLIEGIADWVRLNCGLSPPHWTREPNGEWDRGYEHTAYFLQYLEERFGEGTVRRLNDKLRHSYEAERFWTELFGQSVEELYNDYVKSQECGVKVTV